MHEATTFAAPPTLSRFLLSDKPMRFVRGPVGSGKSAACAVELVRRACAQKPDANGIRRTRAAVVRNTLSQLRSTCLVTMEEWYRPIMHFKVSESSVLIRMPLPDGTRVECTIIMLPLDTPQNIQRLLSLELTFAWCSEVREIPLEIIQAVFSRTGRFPSKVNGGATWRGIWAETNSFSEDSEYYDFLEVERPETVDYFIQPGGMDEGAENRENLPATYYEDMIEANTEAWCDQYVHNKIGPSLSGQAVFANIFLYDFHTTDAIEYDQTRPIVVGMDTGRNPAAVLGQLDPRGRLCVLASTYGENMGIEKFLTQVLKPFIYEFFPQGRFVCVVDPSGVRRTEIGEESVIEAIKRLGFLAAPAVTNAISPRLRAVERYLNQQVDGKGAVLIDRRYNAMLLRALQHDYRFKRNKEGDLGEIPDKGHPESDLADALQYLCLGADSAQVGRVIRRQERRESTPPPVGGWT